MASSLRPAVFVVLSALLIGCTSSGPEATQPARAEAAATEPALAEPAATEPALAEPAATEPPTLPGPSDVALIWEQFGGCYDAEIAFCPRWIVLRDGSVTVQLPREFDSDRVNGSGIVDPDLVGSWIDVAATTNFEELAARVGDGPCTAVVDGIDQSAAIPWMDVTLTECDLAFDEREPFFKALLGLGRAVQAAAPSNLDRYVAENPNPTPIPPTPVPLPDMRPYEEAAFHEEIMTWRLEGDCPDSGVGLAACPRWSVRVDGEAVVGIDHPQMQQYTLSWGPVDPELVEAVYVAAATIDRREWLDGLPPSTTPDEAISTFASIPLAGINVRSDMVDLGADDPLLAAMRALGEAMMETAPLEDPNGLIEIILGE